MFRSKFIQISGPFALPLIVLAMVVILPLVLLTLTSFLIWGAVGRVLLGRSSPTLSRNELFAKLMQQAQGRKGPPSESEPQIKPDIEVQGRTIE